MDEIIQTATLGAILGASFGAVGFPPPVPQSLAGVVGIVGIFLGWYVVNGMKG